MIAVTSYVGPAGDRNIRGMQGASNLGEALCRKTGHRPGMVGSRRQPIPGGWAAQLEAALPDLRRLGIHIEQILNGGGRPMTVMGRCVASLATLPPVARRHPDAAIVWFDAHGDCDVPTDGVGSESGYLGGMVLTGAAGLWETGLGGDLALGQVVLVGGRDLDPAERLRIENGEITLVEGGPDLGARLRKAIRDRSVYVHLDCDVLEPGLVPTEYHVPGGLSLLDLTQACTTLAEYEVLGAEIAELEGEWPNGETDDGQSVIEANRSSDVSAAFRLRNALSRLGVRVSRIGSTARLGTRA